MKLLELAHATRTPGIVNEHYLYRSPLYVTLMEQNADLKQITPTKYM